MPPSSAYTVTESLSHGSRATLHYRAIRCTDGRPVILEVLDPRQSRPKDLERLKHEYEIGTLLRTPAVVKPLALDTYQGMPALVLEDFGGQALDSLAGAPMALGRFLPLAVRIAAAVAEMHREGVIHKDLKPHNILRNPTTEEVKIADLGLASRLPREQQPAQPPRLIEGSLPYLAPEQTGRTNRAIDDRTDLYALGVTLYQLLTGRLPFEARDPAEWVHCHVARAPPSPAEAVPDLPEPIARIVLKLLSKMPEDRYQSARGLRLDLERCLEQWSESGRIEPFALGSQDVTGRLQIPQKLYGREAEIGLLLDAFGRVTTSGAPELLLVSGYSGIGKSTLVHELHRPIVRERGSFLSGKFDQYQRDIPYATLVRAFRELVLEILAESEDRLAVLRQRLSAALGINAQLIVDVIPPVELVLGPQPAASELPPVEALNRFRMVFRRFIGVFAREEHPLALFLDDLQWADSASLGLLQELLAHPETHHLLVIGAYRDNEVSASHPLMLALDEARKAGARVSDIVLGPIPPEHFAAFVGDALHCRPEQAAPLAELVRDKTAGNPFFAIQFLLSLHEAHLIEFDGQAGAFRWDVAKIREKGFTDNVVELMAGKLVRLPERTQEALKLLACLGSAAEVALLAVASDRSEEVVRADLWEATRAGLVLRQNDTYRFLHDRVQEAAYSRIPEDERAAMHLGIGRLLSARAAPGEIEEKIFEIVNHYGRGAALIGSREERERVAEWNLIAGERAKGSAAYASALKYFAAGAALLPEDRWERRYDLTFALEFHRAECEYLTGELGAAKERLVMLSCRARDLVDAAAVTCVRVALCTTLDRSDRAVDACLDYLRRVGVEWSPHPTAEEVQNEYSLIWKHLGSRPIEELIDLPGMTDPIFRATMDVLTAVQSPALFTDEHLHCLVTCRMVNLTLEHGSSDGSSIAYVRLGTVLGPRFGDYRAGYRFGKVGFDLLEKYGLPRFKARVYLDFGHLINPWTRPMRLGLALLRRGLAAAQDNGDLLYASYTRNCAITLLLALGDPLGEVQREAEDALDLVRKTRFGLIVDILTGQLRLIRALRGLLPDFSSFSDAELDEGLFEQHLEGDPRLAIAACWYWIRKLQARFFAGDNASAIAAAAKAQELLWTSPSFFEVAEHHFYGALARAAHFGAASAEEQARHRAALHAHHAELAVWASTCPENFGNRAALVAAEIARIEGRGLDAERLYEEAIVSARDNGFVHNEAVAYEVASRFYRARGLELFADTYLREARACYARWGADGKVRQIDQQHPLLAEPRSPAVTATVAVRPEQLDLFSVTKASQSISGEIVLDKLVRRLLEVVLEQGGAQKACLLLRQDSGFSIEAEAALEEKRVVTTILGPVIPGPPQCVPSSLVHYVQRTKERVILDDAAADAGKVAGDDYLARVRPRSVLCMPILRQAEVVGLLYLENNLVTGAFTPERLAALELLATQAAISLQNALLLANEQAARSGAEEAERRASFLAEAGALLSASLEYEETLARLGRLCVRSLCDWCVIDVVEDGQIRRLAGAHEDPAKEPLLEELQRRYPPGWDSPHPAVTVLSTGVPLLHPDLSDERIRELSADDEHMRISRALGTQSSMIVPLTARGQTFGVLSLVSSAPGRRYGAADLELAQEVARRAASAIDNARLYRASQQAVRLRSEFLTVASHELNTPVTSLMLAVQTLRRASPAGQASSPQTMDRLLALVERQGARLTKLVADLLDVSRIEARQSQLELSDVDLGDLVREVVERFGSDLAQSACSVSIVDEGGVVGRWDRGRIDRVITNLLSNAIKFGAGKPIEISVGSAQGVARLAVRDHGIGIDPAEQGRIFGRFERVVSERHYGGLGLGLHISRRIVEDHGGSIRCESRPGAGATFTVDLPRAPPALP